MGTVDPRIERYLSKDRPWRAEMCALRALLLEEDVTETLKWRQPCYGAFGSNIAIIGSLKEHAVLSFLKGVLLEDPKGLLMPPGPNSRSARMMKFTSVEGVRTNETDIRDFVRQAIVIEKEGRKVNLPKDDIALPETLVAAFASDPELEQAFLTLSPGRQRGYVLHIDGAKQLKTRQNRIEKCRTDILAGKGMHDR